jgi:predicted nicotinamide N-methyase
VRHLPEGEEGFDVLILADLLFNHSEHGKLVRTVELTLKKTKDAKAYVFFTPYRPWLLEKDLAFFELAREKGFVVEKTFEKVMDKVMFEEDPGVSMPRSWRLAEKLTKGRMNCSDVRYMDMSSVGRLEGGVEQNSRPKYVM